MNNEIKSENIVDLYVTPIMPIVLGKNFSPAEKFDAIRQSMESYATSRISELEGKVEFYRRETSKLRDYLEEHKIGKPSQKLFDALYEHIAELEAENEKNINWANDAETRAIAADERIVELEAEKDWVSVNDLFPDKEGLYVVLCPKYVEDPIVARWNNEGWFDNEVDFHQDITDHITHWMVIPQPPKEQ